MEGWLRKHRVVDGNWISGDKRLTSNIRMRYFRLSDVLTYYENDKSNKAKGVIELSNADIVEADQWTGQPSFVIFSPTTNTSCILFAENTDAKVKWVRQLSSAVMLRRLKDSTSSLN
eukprot:c9820_g1_i1.p1 GENE.c9820_g1_i1~~c9820_g1_i1.p1  ORF type:complete len:117 (-),score=33.02 c9820_g1_i1:461-811(-)